MWSLITCCHKTLTWVWYRQKEENMGQLQAHWCVFWHCSVGFGGLSRQLTSPFPLLGWCFPFLISCCYPLPNLKGRAFLHLLLVPARIPACAVCSLPLIKLSLGIKQTNTKDCSVGRREEGRWSYLGHWSHLMLKMPRSAPPVERSGSWVRLPIVHRALVAFPAPHPQEEAGLPPSWENGCTLGWLFCMQNFLNFFNAGHDTVALLLLHR